MADLSSFINIGANTASFVGDVTANINISATGAVTASGFVTTGASGNISGADVIQANTVTGYGNLRLQPDLANSAGAFLDVYVTVGPDVHIAGNGENVIIGRDDTANVRVNTDGNVNIQASTGTPHTWNFGADGDLTLPRDASNVSTDPYLILSGGGNPSIESIASDTLGPDNLRILSNYLNLNGYTGRISINPEGGNIAADANLVLTSNASGTPTSLTFDTTGNLTIPGAILAQGVSSPAPVISGFAFVGNGAGLTNIANLSNGTSNVTIPTANADVIVNANTANWIFGTSGNLTFPSGANIDSGNLNGGTPSASVALNAYSPDGNTVTIQAQGNSSTAVIKTYDAANTAARQWSFDNAGNITIPGNIIGVAGGYNQPNFIQPNSADTNWSFGISSDLSANFWMQAQFYGQNQATRGFRVLEAEGNTVAFSVNGQGTANVYAMNMNQSITWPGASQIYEDTVLTFSGPAGVAITSPSATGITAGTYTWTFDTTGNLTVPGGTVPSGNAQYDLGTATSTFRDAYFSGTVNATEFKNTQGALTAGIDAVGINANAGNSVYLYADGANVGWTFDTAGVLTVPGEGIIQSLNDTVILQSKNTGTGDTVSMRFGTNGGLFFEGTEYPYGWLSLTNNAGNADITAASGPAGSGTGGKNINITAGSADQSGFYTTAGGSVNLYGGIGAFNDGGGGGPGGNINIVSGNSADPAGHAGNINLTAGSSNWVFDYTGNLTVASNILASGFVSATGNVRGGNINTAGNVSASGIVTGNITSTPTFGQFYSNVTQTSTSNTVTSMTLNNTDISNGVSVVSDSRITLAKAGKYNIQFSAQLAKATGGTANTYIWLAKNGTEVPDSATDVTLIGNGARQIAAWNWIVSAAANDYFEIIWYQTDSVTIDAVAAASPIPGIPSLIVTVVPVGA